MLRDDDIYPVFRDALQSVEPLLTAAVERVRKDVDTATADRVSDALRQVFGRVLKELADLENPMRTLLGEQPGDGGIELPVPSPGGQPPMGDADRETDETPGLDDLEPRPAEPVQPEPAGGARTSPDGRHRHLPSVAPDPQPGHRRSRFDADTGTVMYNEQHADFLVLKADEAALLDYLATLVAKEYVVYNNPRADGDDLAEELVRMLVRVRRHLPARTRRR